MAHWKKLTQFTGDAYFQSMMGHGLRARSQAELSSKLHQRGFLVGPDYVIEAYNAVDRKAFCADSTPEPYSNAPAKISNTHSMSTPQLHAQIISLLAPRLGPEKVAAEVGAGSGYLPAVFAAAGCRAVFACEAESALRELCRKRLGASVRVVEELPHDHSYDAIYVSPSFQTQDAMLEFLNSYQYSNNALAVAAYGEQGLGGQQLCLLERTDNAKWQVHELFRVMGEAMMDNRR